MNERLPFEESIVSVFHIVWITSSLIKVEVVLEVMMCILENGGPLKTTLEHLISNLFFPSPPLVIWVVFI